VSRIATRRRSPSPRRPEGRPRIAARGIRQVLLLAASIALSIPVAPARAETLRYSLEIHDREAASYAVDLPVRNAGTVRVDVEWSGGRTLAFRIEGPGSTAVRSRRAGPSPQHLEAEVTDSDLAAGGPFKLFVHSLPDRGEIEGTLTVALPARAEPERAEARVEPVRPVPPPDPWLLPDVAPRGTDDRLARVYDTSESLRAWIVDVGGTPRNDACGWQSELLRYLATRRTELKDGQAGVDEATARFLLRVVKAVALVEGLRSSDDPFLTGPVPEDTNKKKAWMSLRKRRLEPIEGELDALGTLIRRDHAPELAEETWPQRLVGCLTACERHFEQRVVVAGDDAENGSLAVDQWPGIQAAAGALRALAFSDVGSAVAAGEATPER